MAHVISYPQDIDTRAETDPVFVKIKAELLFNGNKLLAGLPLQFDDSVTVLYTKENQVLCIHNIVCSICGAIVGATRAYCDMHLELHIKNGE